MVITTKARLPLTAFTTAVIAIVLSLVLIIIESVPVSAIDFTSPPAFASKFGSTGSGNGQFSGPRDVNVDAAGNIYVSDTLNHRIQKFDANGTYVSQFGSAGTGNGQFNQAYDLDFDSAGNIFVLDLLNTRVQKFNSSGVYVSQFGTAGTGNGQFSSARAIEIDDADNILVVDSGNNRVQVFNSSGVYVTKFGTAGFGNGQFDYPADIALDSAGNIFIADSSNFRIQKFNSSYVYVSQFGGTEGSGNGEFEYPYGLAIDSHDNIIVQDTYNYRIQVFDANGTYLSQFGSNGSGNGQLNQAEGIAVTADGKVYVADKNNHRIQMFTFEQESPLVNPTGGDVLVATPAGTDITCSSVVTEESLAAQDSTKMYPYGLVNYCFDVPNAGDTVTVSVTFESGLNVGDVVAKKFDSNTNTYSEIVGATISATTLNANPAIRISYDVTDGGALDEDGAANGSITDPVGLAVANDSGSAPITSASSAGTLADTGVDEQLMVGVAITLLLLGVVIITRLFNKASEARLL